MRIELTLPCGTGFAGLPLSQFGIPASSGPILAFRRIAREAHERDAGIPEREVITSIAHFLEICPAIGADHEKEASQAMEQPLHLRLGEYE